MARERKYNVRTKEKSLISEKSKEAISGVKDTIIIDMIIPIALEKIRPIAQKAFDEGERLAKEKIFPYIKFKFRQIVPVVKAKFGALKARIKNRKLKNKESVEFDAKVVADEQKLYTKKEVDQIMKNMKYAILYIASGIKELSNAVIIDADDPEEKAKIEAKLKELSSDDIKSIIDFTLERKNRYLLDKETLKMFKAFKHDELIVNGELVPIKKYIEVEKLNDIV